MDSPKCQTVTATPAKPGELPVGLDRRLAAPGGVLKFRFDKNKMEE
jgi:hypothetical protein